MQLQRVSNWFSTHWWAPFSSWVNIGIVKMECSVFETLLMLQVWMPRKSISSYWDHSEVCLNDASNDRIYIFWIFYKIENHILCLDRLPPCTKALFTGKILLLFIYYKTSLELSSINNTYITPGKNPLSRKES